MSRSKSSGGEREDGLMMVLGRSACLTAAALSVSFLAVWVGVGYLQSHAIHWQRHRETAAASETDCFSGRSRASDPAGRPAVLLTAAGRANSTWGSHEN